MKKKKFRKVRYLAQGPSLAGEWETQDSDSESGSREMP